MIVMKRRGKLVALATAAVGMVVLVAAGFAAKDRIREQWYIWRLERGSKEAQVAAAEMLGEMRSVRAVPLLMAALRKEAVLHFEAVASPDASGLVTMLGDPDWYLGERGVRIRKALVGIGRPATLELLRAIRDLDPMPNIAVYGHFVSALFEIYADEELVPTLQKDPRVSESEVILLRLEEDPTQPPEVRQVATEIRTRNQTR